MTGVAAVFDTNVIVSGFLSPHGPPGRIVQWLRQEELVAVLDDRIVAEYSEVLHRPELRIESFEVDTSMAIILANARVVEIAQADVIVDLPDASDAPFLECAIKAGCALVTGNLKHFPARSRRGVRVLTPAEFVSLSFRSASHPG